MPGGAVTAQDVFNASVSIRDGEEWAAVSDLDVLRSYAVFIQNDNITPAFPITTDLATQPHSNRRTRRHRDLSTVIDAISLID